MTTNQRNDIIDLTNSFRLADHSALSNMIIELDTDDSFSPVPSPDIKSVGKRRSLRLSNKKDEQVLPVKLGKRVVSSKFGDCPICYDELGTNQLGSTKCGHVFCLECLQKSLSYEKRCPTCRTTLRGASAYHPLYFGKDYLKTN